MRQGCPLAQFLFVVVLDALGYKLIEERYRIRGLQLFGGMELLDAYYANNVALYLEGTEINLSNTYDVLSIFCLAMGSKIN